MTGKNHHILFTCARATHICVGQHGGTATYGTIAVQSFVVGVAYMRPAAFTDYRSPSVKRNSSLLVRKNSSFISGKTSPPKASAFAPALGFCDIPSLPSRRMTLKGGVIPISHHASNPQGRNGSRSSFRRMRVTTLRLARTDDVDALWGFIILTKPRCAGMTRNPRLPVATVPFRRNDPSSGSSHRSRPVPARRPSLRASVFR